MQPPNAPTQPLRARRLAGRRGFTLVELAVVVIIVSVFAALAIPQATEQLRDRRIHETAQRVVHTFRNARLRALGQGSAVLVTYGQGTNNQGLLVTREALVGVNPDTCQTLASPSCLQTDWNGGTEGDDYRTIRRFDVGTEFGLANARVVMHGLPPTSTAVPNLHICFTPVGRAYISTNPTPDELTFTPLTAVPFAEIYRTDGGGRRGLTRRALILPNGMSRLEL